MYIRGFSRLDKHMYPKTENQAQPTANSSDVLLCAGEWSYAGHTLVSEFPCLVLFCGIPVLPCALMAPSFPLWSALQCVTTPQLSC